MIGAPLHYLARHPSPHRLGSQDFAGLAGSGGQQRGLDRRAGHRCKNFAVDAVLVGSQLVLSDKGGQEERSVSTNRHVRILSQRGTGKPDVIVLGGGPRTQ